MIKFKDDNEKFSERAVDILNEMLINENKEKYEKISQFRLCEIQEKLKNNEFTSSQEILLIAAILKIKKLIMKNN